MRLVFAGTPDFAVQALDALLAAGHEVAAVFTQPDRPAGRGRKLQASPVALRAEAAGLPVHKPAKLHAEAQSLLREIAPQVMVVVAYGLILPQAVLDIPALGCLNIHASLLPRWRGAAPIARAVEAGDTRTGITIMRMDAGLDTGPMLLEEAVDITPQTTAAELEHVLAPMGGRLVVSALADIAAGRSVPRPQPAEGATYAKKLSKDEAHLDFKRPSLVLARQVQAFNPAPIAWAELDGERLRFWNASALPGSHSEPGRILGIGPEGLHIATGDGVLAITTLQRPGGRAMSAAESARGWNPVGRTLA